MKKYEVGMLAKSKAGHDNGQIYIIYKVEGAYVYLVDGKSKTIAHPKKKKKKHVQLILEKNDLIGVDDVGIKRILKLYSKQSDNINFDK